MTMYEEGSPDAKLLFLGQAPSYVEERLGRPLVGPSGEVFNTCLHLAGITRHGTYILNVWPYRVDTDKRSGAISKQGRELWKPRSGFTEFGLAEAEPALARIRASGANLIVPLGAQATELCLGDKRPIMKWRGSILQGCARIGDRKVIPTLHPAATIHGTYLWRYLIIADLEKARVEREYPDLRLPVRNHIIAPSFEDAMFYLDTKRAAEVELPQVATDLEVINHQVSCFSICYNPSETMTIPLTTQDGEPYWRLDEEADIWLAYAKLLGTPEIEKINQNIVGFDAPFLVQQNGIFTKGFLGDTMIAQSIMYPEFRMGLDFITSIHTREPYYKDEGKMWKGVGGPIEQFWTYCGKDAAVALEAWGKLSAEMTEGGYWPTYRMTADLYEPLAFMTTFGFPTDRVKLEQVKTRVQSEIKEKEDELRNEALVPFNPLSPKQCQEYFYGLKGYHPYTNKTGGVTTDDKAMARIFRRYNCREAKLVQEIRGLRKLEGTYLEVNFDADGRMRCAWNPRGTKFGRLSSSQTLFDTGMNMQNIHPEFKEFLVADDDPT